MPRQPSPREIELSIQIVLFLRKDLIFSIFKLEKILAIPEGTLAKCVSEKMNSNIPHKYLFPLIYFLADYGLTIDGYKIEKDTDNRRLYFTQTIDQYQTTINELPNAIWRAFTETLYRKPADSLKDLL